MRKLNYCKIGRPYIEILIEIGFIEEMRTTCNKEVPQTFSHNSLLFVKYDLIRMTQYH